MIVQDWQKIVDGKKDILLYAVKPGQEYAGALPHFIPYVYRGKTRVYQIGKVYAVQPGPAKPGLWYRMDENGIQIAYVIKYRPTLDMDGIYDYDMLTRVASREFYREHGYQPLKVLVENIRLVDVRDITDEFARRAGYSNQIDLIAAWTKKHHPTIEIKPYPYPDMCLVRRKHKSDACLKVSELRQFLGDNTRYQAWLLEVQLQL